MDDYKSKLVAIEGVDVPQNIKDYLDGIKPLVWVVTDNGIGTLKFRTLINFEFSDYFTK